MNKIGNTPLLRLYGFEKYLKTSCKIYGKIEYLNPFGSIKDRVAREVVNTIQSRDTHIIESTSGNMGISLAGIAQILGIKCTIIMPEDMSEKRKELIKSFGGNLILTSSEGGMKESVIKAKEISEKLRNSFFVDQFNNYSSIKAHYNTTAREIILQLKRPPDIIMAGIGTGGTIMGISELFYKMGTEIVGVLPNEPQHKIQGIGAGVPLPLLNYSKIHKIIKVDFKNSERERKILNITDSIHPGISSGALLYALKKLLKDSEIRDKHIVLIFADGYDRYQ